MRSFKIVLKKQKKKPNKKRQKLIRERRNELN